MSKIEYDKQQAFSSGYSERVTIERYKFSGNYKMLCFNITLDSKEYIQQKMIHYITTKLGGKVSNIVEKNCPGKIIIDRDTIDDRCPFDDIYGISDIEFATYIKSNIKDQNELKIEILLPEKYLLPTYCPSNIFKFMLGHRYSNVTYKYRGLFFGTSKRYISEDLIYEDYEKLKGFIDEHIKNYQENYRYDLLCNVKNQIVHLYGKE